MGFLRLSTGWWIVALTAVLAPAYVGAQTPADSVRAEYRLPLPPTVEILAWGPNLAPGVTVASPSGFGAARGDAFVGAGFQHRTRTFTRSDGAVAVGVGFGDPQDRVGVEVVATSFGTVRTCCRGGVSLKAHRLLPENASVAMGLENALLWNDKDHRPATDSGRSPYVAASKLFLLRDGGVHPFSSLTLTVGAGSGRFRRERDVVEDRFAVNAFAAAGVRVLPTGSIVVDWTGQDLAAGLSLVPWGGRPLFVTPAVADLTTRPRFIVGAAYGFNTAGIIP